MAPPRKPRELAAAKHKLLIAAFLKTNSVNAAGREVGYSSAAASAILQRPEVLAEITKQRQAIVEHTKYDVEAAMKDMREAAAFARETSNATALVRAYEMMMKLHGLLIERIDQRQVGNFKLRIGGIDDEPEEPKTIENEPNYEDVFGDGD